MFARLVVASALTATLVACNMVPALQVVTPTEGQEFQPAQPVVFSVSMQDDSPIGYLNMVVTSDLDGVLEGVRNIANTGQALIVDDMQPGYHTVTIDVTDPDKGHSQAVVHFTIIANSNPEVSFVSPVDGAVVAQGEPMQVEVLVTDVNDEPVNRFNLTWGGTGLFGITPPPAPDADGRILFTVADPQLGSHDLVLQVDDTLGAITTAAVEFEVVPLDADGDGWRNAQLGGEDCDDGDAGAHPGASEVCDDTDDDCDGAIDEDVLDPPAWYLDRDDDGFGNREDPAFACQPPANRIPTGGDCDDGDPSINPAAAEVCDGVDNDCDDDADALTCWQDLSIAVWTARGEAEYQGAGLVGSPGGDIDGDGRQDFIVGAPESSLNAYKAGAGYVLYGNLSGEVHLSDQPIVQGNTSDDFLATWVSGGVDLDRDGKDDVALSAPGANELGLPQGGAVYVFFGEVALTAGLASEADLILAGDRNQGRAGSVVLLVDDVTGDRRPDVVVGVAEDDRGATDAGGLIVVDGRDATGDLVDIGESTWLEGSVAGGFAGLTAAVAGDFDSDGVSDLAVGAPGLDAGAGGVYLVLGPVTAGAELEDAAGLLKGDASGDGAGLAVSAAGDTNGDGKAELLVGAPFHATGGVVAGSAYLVSAPYGGTAKLGAVRSAELIGDEDGAQAGLGLAGLGDVDGDGKDDVAVGAPVQDFDVVDNGAVYVFYGAVAGTLHLADSLAPLAGETKEGNAGTWVGGPGDVTGDGFADLLVGAPYDRTDVVKAGAAYLVSGAELVHP